MKRRATKTADPVEYSVTVDINAPRPWLGQDFGCASFLFGFVKPPELRRLAEFVHANYSDSVIKVVHGDDDVVFHGDVRDYLIELLKA